MLVRIANINADIAQYLYTLNGVSFVIALECNRIINDMINGISMIKPIIDAPKFK